MRCADDAQQYRRGLEKQRRVVGWLGGARRALAAYLHSVQREFSVCFQFAACSSDYKRAAIWNGRALSWDCGNGPFFLICYCNGGSAAEYGSSPFKCQRLDLSTFCIWSRPADVAAWFRSCSCWRRSRGSWIANSLAVEIAEVASVCARARAYGPVPWVRECVHAEM